MCTFVQLLAVLEQLTVPPTGRPDLPSSQQMRCTVAPAAVKWLRRES
jgi:hypothetical protein